MKKLLLLILSMASAMMLSAQTNSTISGTVELEGTDISGIIVKVTLVSTGVSTSTAPDGSFSITTDRQGDDVLIFTGQGVANYQRIINIRPGSNELGIVKLTVDSRATADDDAMLIVTESELDAEGSSQTVSGLLSSRGDVFTSNASYQFSPMRFRVRGLDGKYNQTYINGILMNDAERGYFSYSQVGGLNDMLRTRESVNGTEQATFTFGNVGGAQNINTRASAIRKGLKVSQVASNRTYISRTMATYATGMMDNGWAFALSASYRWANSGYVEGTFYDAWAFAAAAEKRFNPHHSLSLTILGAPTHRGQQAGSTQEAYDLTPTQTFFRTQGSGYGNNNYNANWGYQNGVVRNAKQVKSFTPIAILSHEWKIDDMSRLTTSVGYKYQMDGRTAMNWYKAADPRPDYYRNLPNYYLTGNNVDTEAAALREELWRTDVNYRQINWDRMYQTNYLANERGTSGRYMVENRRNDQQVVTLNSVLNYKFSEHWKLDGGVELQSTIANHYKLVDDLLGANYWLDIDQYGERDNPGDKNFMQNDLNNPNRKVYVGDRFGYDYDIYTNQAKLWAQATYSHSNFDVYFAAQAAYSNFWRVGNVLNGRCADDMEMWSTFNGQKYSPSWKKTVTGSYGYSPTQNFLTYAAKAGINYRITGRHIIAFNAAFGTNPVIANNAYFSPRVKPNLIPKLNNEMYLNTDLSYYVRTPVVNGRITVYNTMFWNSSDLSSFYNDEYNTFVNFAMYDFNKRHTGAEIGLEFNVYGGFSIEAVAAIGQNIYTTNANATISYENGLEADAEAVINCRGFHLDGTPEIASSIGLHYFHPSYWFFDLNFNYFANSYLDFNPLRRTDAAIAGLDPAIEADNELIHRITDQERLPGGFTIDASIGKSIRINYKYFLNINLSATNILNNRSLKTGGYEQSRFSATHAYNDRTTYLNRFPPKYFYAYGATIYLNIGFRF